jgi:hypothetical protein
VVLNLFESSGAIGSKMLGKNVAVLPTKDTPEIREIQGELSSRVFN